MSKGYKNAIVSSQIGWAVDTKGNVALQTNRSLNATNSSSASASFSMYESTSNAPTINALAGTGFQLGYSNGIPVEGIPIARSEEINIIPNYKDKTVYFGTTSSKGIGTPGESVYAGISQTSGTGIQFNVFDVAKGFYVKLMEW